MFLEVLIKLKIQACPSYTILVYLICTWSSYSDFSIFHEICIRFHCALFCCGYIVVWSGITWSIYPYPSGLLHWHWSNHMIAPGGHFKNTYELLNLRALKFSPVDKTYTFQCMGKIFCVEFQRYPLKFHTKYLTHTLKDMIFVQHWNFKGS